VAKRIEELQARNERKAEMAALTRDELVKILTEIVQAARNRLPETRAADALKAAEMLSKMCGWNEPEKVNVQNVELKVDAALLAELRKGAAAMNALGSSRAKLIGAPFELMGPDTPTGTPCEFPPHT
jgi:hypothetical protein